MRRLIVILLAAVLLVGAGAGCPGDQDKGKNSKADRPKAED